MNNIVNMIDEYLKDFYYLKSFKKNINEYISLDNHYRELITILERIKYEIERTQVEFLEQLKNEIERRLKWKKLMMLDLNYLMHL